MTDVTSLGRTQPVAHARRLVLGGVGSSVLPAGTYAAVRVWVEAPRELRFALRMRRDGETYRPQWERCAAQESASFAADGTRARRPRRRHGPGYRRLWTGARTP